MRKNICFAYFGQMHGGESKFLGWYSDSFGTLTKLQPKMYGYSEEQVEIVAKNFRYKMTQLREDANMRKFNPGLVVLDASLLTDAKTLGEYDDVTLCIVECPIYDGPNEAFDAERHKNWRAYNRTPFFEPENRYWIYADYQLVKGWAESAPAEFLGVIHI
jgi:hypothetical protein